MNRYIRSAWIFPYLLSLHPFAIIRFRWREGLPMRYGALEAGGTKMVLAVMDDHGNMMESVSIPTRAPDDTMPEMISFFSGKGISSLGIGSFGPLDLNPASPAYGSVTESPKLSGVIFRSVRLLRMPCRFRFQLIRMLMPQPLQSFHWAPRMENSPACMSRWVRESAAG